MFKLSRLTSGIPVSSGGRLLLGFSSGPFDLLGCGWPDEFPKDSSSLLGGVLKPLDESDFRSLLAISISYCVMAFLISRSNITAFLICSSIFFS